MATNFPTSVDNFTNPTANDSLNLPSHSTQHANANDAIEAIETTLFAGGINYTGLVHLATKSFSGQTAVSFDNCFNANYTSYRIMCSLETIDGLRMRMRKNGSDVILNYSSAVPHWLSFGGFDGVDRVQDGAFWFLRGASGENGIQIDIESPFVARKTTAFANSAPVYGGNAVWMSVGGHILDDVTSYDGFTIYPISGTFNGSIRVYGYRNA